MERKELETAGLEDKLVGMEETITYNVQGKAWPKVEDQILATKREQFEEELKKAPRVTFSALLSENAC